MSADPEALAKRRKLDVSQKDQRELICELCRSFYGLGWVSGTGGGISIRDPTDADRVYIAPSGVQKERMVPDDMFLLRLDGTVISAPQGLKPSQCTPLFLHAYRLRDAGAVIHTHSMHAMLVTVSSPTPHEFRIKNQEMIKGIQGHGYDDTLVIPIIENTRHEAELADSLAEAIEKYPSSPAVLVRHHGVYVWGKDWIQAKTQCECLDYLFQAYLDMRRLQVGSECTRV